MNKTSHKQAVQDSVDTRLEFEEVNRTLDTLTEDQRQVIRMRFIAELPIQEVANKLGRTEGAIKALQYRGLQSLARQLQQQVG